MHQTKKGDNYQVRPKIHIEVDAESGFVQTLAASAARLNCAPWLQSRYYLQEFDLFVGLGRRGEKRREEANGL
jgi:hypothetical protein